MRTLVLLAAVACSGGKPTGRPPGATPTDPLDHDGDGFAIPGDCDDSDASVHPGAPDAPYDGIDSDCAGDSDYDADQDGFETADHGGADCDDADPSVNPDADEVCNGLDDDCDGTVDGESAKGASPYYVDADGDGFGGGDPQFLCDEEVASGLILIGGDCDDDDPFTYPSAPDVACDAKDNDCLDNTFEIGRVTLDGVDEPDLATAVAASSSGSRIDLCEGRYSIDDLALPHGLTIAGRNGPITVLDGNGNRALVTVDTAEPVELDGLTLANGLAADHDGVRRGGGLYVAAGGRVSGADLHFAFDRAGEGGCIYLEDGASLSLSGSNVDDCTADGAASSSGVSFGGGIYAGQSVLIALTSTTVDRNNADQCGGVELGEGSTLDGDGSSTVDDGTENGLGGAGICATSASISGLEIARNVAGNAGGGVLGQDVTLTDVQLLGNVAGLVGGGASLSGTSTLTGCTVQNNVAMIDGGGIDATGSLVVEDSAVIANTATLPWLGGGARLATGSLDSRNTDWGAGPDDNTSDDMSLDGAGEVYSWAGVASFVCTDPAGTCL